MHPNPTPTLSGRHLWVRAASAAAVALLCTGAQAQVTVYDDFSSPVIDNSRWQETESWRYVDAQGRLNLGRYSLGSSASDTGVLYENLNLTATDAAPARQLRATLRVTAISVPQGCPTNTTQTYAYSRARVIGALFSARSGGPVAGDRTGDVLAQIRVGRTSSTSDATGVLRVQGVLSVCTSPDCNQSSLIGSTQDLGTTTLGSSVKAAISWSKSLNTVSFSRDGQPAKVVSYTESDKFGPAVAFNNVSVRNDVPSCLGAPVRAGIGATFDNVVIVH